MTLIYVDANVYLDYFYDRSDSLRPLGEFAYLVFKRAMSCEFRIAISPFLVYELEKGVTKDKLDRLLTRLDNLDKLEWVFSDSGLKAEALNKARLLEIPWQDVLHALLAKKVGADTVVTRDKHLFSIDFIESKFPENL